MPMIRECVVTTADAQGNVHIAPLGLIADGNQLGHCAVPALDDARQFARRAVRGCQLYRRRAHLRRLPDRRRDWPLVATEDFIVPRLLAALTHAELSVAHVEEHEQRPRFHCQVTKQVQHAPFEGMNRAKAAVLELAVLSSRLDFLPREKIETRDGLSANRHRQDGGARRSGSLELACRESAETLHGLVAVMAGLDPAIHAPRSNVKRVAWMRGSSPRMTRRYSVCNDVAASSATAQAGRQSAALPRNAVATGSRSATSI